MDEQRPPDRMPSPESPRRRAYQTPRLTEYGSITKLTRGSKSVKSDFPQAGFQKRD
jgi:hypothetical protein